MYKNVKKVLVSFLSIIILSVSMIGAVTNGYVSADSTESINSQTEKTQTFVIPKNVVPIPSDALSESKMGSGAIKYAIKQVLKHPRTFAGYIGKFMGKDVEKAVLKNFSKHIAPRLKPLLKYTDGLEDAVAMAVYRGVKAATHSEYLASMAKVGAKIAIGLM